MKITPRQLGGIERMAHSLGLKYDKVKQLFKTHYDTEIPLGYENMKRRDASNLLQMLLRIQNKEIKL